MSGVDSLKEPPQAKVDTKEGNQEERQTLRLSPPPLITARGEEGRNGGNRPGELRGSRENGGKPWSAVCEAMSQRECKLLLHFIPPRLLYTRNPYHQPGTFQVPVTSLEVLSVVWLLFHQEKKKLKGDKCS